MLTMNLTKIMPYYGYTLKDIEAKGILEKFKVVWPHVHTAYSLTTLQLGQFIGRFNECTIEIPQLLKLADKHGISQVVITDHDSPRKKIYKSNYSTFKGAIKAEKLAKENGHNVEIIKGQEILFTPSNQKMSVHILLFPLNEEIDIKYKTRTIEELADYCYANNIKMVAPHPLVDESMKFCEKTLLYDRNTPNKINKEIIKFFDAVSVINALSFKQLNIATIYATHGLANIAKIGECDAHSYEALKLAGTLIPYECSGIIESIEKQSTVPFGAYGASKEIVYSWARNAYNLVVKYAYNLEKEQKSNIDDGLEVFKQIHGEKFKNQKALMHFIILLIRLGRFTAFPIAERIVYDRSLRSINKLISEITE